MISYLLVWGLRRLIPIDINLHAGSSVDKVWNYFIKDIPRSQLLFFILYGMAAWFYSLLYSLFLRVCFSVASHRIYIVNKFNFSLVMSIKPL